MLMQKGENHCRRCGKPLKNELSKLIGLGPTCRKHVGADAFAGDLQLPERELKRREEVLKKGMVIDFGCAWKIYRNNGVFPLKISLRYSKDEKLYEVYGTIDFCDGTAKEFTVAKTKDLKKAIQVAAIAGPRFTAEAEREEYGFSKSKAV